MAPATGYLRGAKGCAIIDNGNKIFITGLQLQGNSWGAAVGAFDLNNNSWTDLLPLTTPINTNWLISSRIFRSIDPATNKPCVYIPQGDGMAAFIGTDDISTLVFEPIANGTVGLDPPQYVAAYATGLLEFAPVFLNAQPTNEHGAATLALEVEGECCMFREEACAIRGYSVPSNTSWTATSNPFGNVDDLLFTEDLIVPAGVHLTVTGMKIRFSPTAKLLIQRGGWTTVSGTTLTSEKCIDLRWPGVRIEGNTENTYQDDNPFVTQEFEQGHLTMLNNSIIENAHIGILCGRQNSAGIGEVDYNGGYAVCHSSTFRNCITGFLSSNYQRTGSGNEPNGPELNNRSRFENCTFLTDADFITVGGVLPIHHANIQLVRGISFNSCKFKNISGPGDAIEDKGRGIFAYSAGFSVRGTTTPESATFENLEVGVIAWPGPFHTYEVDRVAFKRNKWGIFDLASQGARIIRNTFTLPDLGPGTTDMVGLYLSQSTGYVVEENEYSGIPSLGLGVGIYFNGTQKAENQIYNNKFNNLYAGTLVNGRHKGNTPPTEYQGLQLLCGDYTSNVIDYGLNANTYIKQDQGTVFDGDPFRTQLAGNRWLDPADLTTTWDIFIDDDQPDGSDENYPMPFFDYKRHDVDICDPLNSSPYFSDQPQAIYNSFIKATDCGKGNLVPGPGPGGILQYQLVADQLHSAVSVYKGTINNGGENLEIMDAIKQDSPVLASHILRDYLLARTPLSDDVLIAMLLREVPMDNWHAAQVLLANCKLGNKVLQVMYDSELLSPYQIGLVENAEDGTQAMQLVRAEIVERSTEKARLQAHLTYDLLTDSTDADAQQNYLQALSARPDLADRYLLAEAYLWLGDAGNATAQLDTIIMEKDLLDPEILLAMVSMMDQMGGDWPNVGPNQEGQLLNYLEGSQPGVTMARAMAYQAGFTDELPAMVFPSKAKSRHRRSAASSYGMAPEDALVAFPNPTTGISYVVLPKALENEGLLRIADALGREVQVVNIITGKTLLELDLSTVDPGLYTCTVYEGNAHVGTLKLTVKD